MPTKKKVSQPANPSRRRSGAGKAKAEDVAAQLERTHAEVSAAIVAGYGNVENAMKQAEAAVEQAINGVAKAIRLAHK